MLKIKWTDKNRNEEDLKRMGEKGRLWKSMLNRKEHLNGHSMRQQGLLKTLIEEHMNGKRSGGRPYYESHYEI